MKYLGSRFYVCVWVCVGRIHTPLMFCISMWFIHIHSVAHRGKISPKRDRESKRVSRCECKERNDIDSVWHIHTYSTQTALALQWEKLMVSLDPLEKLGRTSRFSTAIFQLHYTLHQVANIVSRPECIVCIKHLFPFCNAIDCEQWKSNFVMYLLSRNDWRERNSEEMNGKRRNADTLNPSKFNWNDVCHSKMHCLLDHQWVGWTENIRDMHPKLH